MPGHKLYPIAGRFLSDVPHAIHLVPSKEVARDLIASGAFTDNPRHPERDPDAPDLGDEPVTHPRTRFQGEQPEEAPIEAPQEAGPSDSAAEEN